MTRVAVITIAQGRHDHLAAQHRSLALGTRLPDDYLVVAMDDPGIEALSTEGRATPRRRVERVATSPQGLPLARARNRGIEDAFRTGADVVVALDVDCLAGPGLVAAYADVVTRRPDTIWAGPVTYLDPPPPGGYDLTTLPALDSPHAARPAPAPGVEEANDDPDLFWSLSFALSRRAWERSGAFCEEYVGYGGEDTDFGHQAVAAGVGLGWCGGARAYHQHHPVERPPVRHVDDILRNGAVFARRWGRWPMLGWLEELERLGHVRRDGDGWVRA